MIILLIIMIILAIPFTFSTVVFRHCTSRVCPPENMSRVNLSELYSYLKSGDLILMAASAPSLGSSFSRTYFTHIGMVVKKNETLFLAEMQTGTNMIHNKIFMEPGCVHYPLLVRLKYYIGSLFVMRLSRPLDSVREQKLTQIISTKKYKYTPTYELILGFIFDKIKFKSLHCFQYIAMLLDEINLTPIILEKSLLDTGFISVIKIFCEFNNYALPDGYYYEYPLQLNYDIDCINID